MNAPAPAKKRKTRNIAMLVLPARTAPEMRRKGVRLVAAWNRRRHIWRTALEGLGGLSGSGMDREVWGGEVRWELLWSE